MAPALPKALAPEKVMTIRHLARTWAVELGYDWVDLERALVEEALNGRLDGGIFLRKGLAVGPTNGAELRELAAQSGEWAQDILVVLRENEALAIHRDTALAFADRRRIKPPSWWKATPGRKVEHRAFPQGEAEEWFAIRIGGWSGEASPPSESDDRAAFEVHLGRRVSREEFREARRRLVPSNWLQPGRRPNSRMKFAAK